MIDDGNFCFYQCCVIFYYHIIEKSFRELSFLQSYPTTQLNVSKLFPVEVLLFTFDKKFHLTTKSVFCDEQVTTRIETNINPAMDTEDKRLVEQWRTPEIVKGISQLQQQNPVPKERILDLLPQLLASCLMYLLVIQAGISMSFSSVLITQLSDKGEIELDTNSASIIASIWSLSLPIGALSSGFIMDKYGRRKTALFICFPFTFGWLLVSFAQNVTMIYLARIVSGITTGLTTCAVVYVAEISSKKTRSGLLCLNSVWVSFGIFLTYILNYFDLHWRTIGYAYAVMSSLCILAILIIPESPQWLLVFNKKVKEERRREQVKSTFSWLYRNQQVGVDR